MARQKKTYDKFKQVIKIIENEGISLRKACERVNMSRDVFGEICDEDSKYNDQYTRAVYIRSEHIFEEILDIADDNSKDKTIDYNGNIVEDREFVSRSRLKIDARKWMLGKMQPKKYGDKLEVESRTENTNININKEVKELTPEEIKAINKALEDEY